MILEYIETMNKASEVVFCFHELNHHFGVFLLRSQDMFLWLTLLEHILRGIVRARMI